MGELISLQAYKEQRPQPREEYLEQYNKLSDTNKWMVIGIVSGLLAKTTTIEPLYNLLSAPDKLRVRQEIKSLFQQEQRTAKGGR